MNFTKKLKVQGVALLPADPKNAPGNMVTPMSTWGDGRTYDMYLFCDDGNAYLFVQQYVLDRRVEWYKQLIVAQGTVNIWQPHSKKLRCKGVSTGAPVMELSYYHVKRVGSGAIRVTYTGPAIITKEDLLEQLM